jgi:hypothetical protein
MGNGEWRLRRARGDADGSWRVPDTVVGTLRVPSILKAIGGTYLFAPHATVRHGNSIGRADSSLDSMKSTSRR